MLGEPGKASGAKFLGAVVVPTGCTGTLQYVQLIDSCRSFHLTSGEDFRKKTDGYWIDTKDPIFEQKVPKGGDTVFVEDDTPGQGLSNDFESVQVKDSFKIWLMWKPDQPDKADRVPLAMATWSWSAEAKAKAAKPDGCAKHWTVTRIKTAGGTGKSTKDSPAATKTISGKDPRPEAVKDKC